MKKSILSIALAALATMSASAIPTTFNYQGVCENKLEAIKVTFNVVDANNDVLYSEVQTIETNENGAFTAQVGTVYAEAWEAIDWNTDGLAIETLINNVKTSKCLLQAVPYANVAASVAGIDSEVLDYLCTDVADLALANRETKTDIAEIKGQIATLENEAENAYMTGFVAQAAYDMADANADAIANVSSDVQGIQESLRGYATIDALNEVEQSYEEWSRDLNETLLESFNAVYEELEALKAVANLDTEDIANILEGLGETQGDVINLTEAVRSNTAGIASLQAEFDALVENLDMTVPVLQQMEEDVEALKAGADVLSTDVAELVQANRENKTDIYEMKLAMESVEMSIPVLQQMEEDVEALKAGSDVLSTDVADLVAANRERATEIAELSVALEELSTSYEQYTRDLQETLRGKANVEDVADIADVVEQLNAAFTNFTKYVDEDLMGAVAEELEALKEVDANVTSDVQGIQEVLRDKASVGELNEKYEFLLRMIKDNAAAIAALTAMIN